MLAATSWYLRRLCLFLFVAVATLAGLYALYLATGSGASTDSALTERSLADALRARRPAEAVRVTCDGIRDGSDFWQCQVLADHTGFEVTAYSVGRDDGSGRYTAEGPAGRFTFGPAPGP